MDSETIGAAIARLLGRTPSGMSQRTLSWEHIINEGGKPRSALDTMKWSDDPVMTPQCRDWQNAGWLIHEVDKNRELATFRRISNTAGFVGEDGVLP